VKEIPRQPAADLNKHHVIFVRNRDILLRCATVSYMGGMA